jgi:O-antigen/teichoic acid export membrane protein
VLAEDVGVILRFLLYSNLSGTARVLTGRVDVLIVGWLTDPTSVGLYRLARSVSDPLAALATPVSQVVFPEISKLASERDVDGIRRLTRRVRQLAAVVVIPACVLTTLAAGWAIPAVLGESFAPAVPLVRIMVWQLLWIPYIWVSALLLSLGRARTVAAMSGLDAAIYVALLLVLVPAFGVTGAAWAILGRFVAWTLVAATVGTRVDRGLELRWT